MLVPLGIMTFMLAGYTPIGWFASVFMVGCGLGMAARSLMRRF